MTREQKIQAKIALFVANKMLQQIMSKNYPPAANLYEMRQCVDWQICYLLRGLIPTLPKDVRAQVQACYDVREQVWSSEYVEQYRAAQKEASSSCLQASNSL